MLPVTTNELWNSNNLVLWDEALACYWSFVRPENIKLEHSLNNLNLERLKNFDPESWYEFLRNEYFRWKYTSPNRYRTTTNQLNRYIQADALDELDNIRQELLSLNPKETLMGLRIASKIHGLGTAGASGLLSLMYPDYYATVDQFVVSALNEVTGLVEADAIRKMNPENLTLSNGVVLINLLTKKALENNLEFGVKTWTPRKIDMVLWACRS